MAFRRYSLSDGLLRQRHGESVRRRQSPRPHCGPIWGHRRAELPQGASRYLVSNPPALRSDSPQPLASDALLRGLGVLYGAAGLHLKPRSTSANPLHSTRCLAPARNPTQLASAASPM